MKAERDIRQLDQIRSSVADIPHSRHEESETETTGRIGVASSEGEMSEEMGTGRNGGMLKPASA